jgi:Tol biopolymer transport system component
MRITAPWLAGLVLVGACEQETPYDPLQCFTDLSTRLSTDEMEGRGIGTEGLEKAALLIEEQFAAMGLEDGGIGYRQPFSAVTGVTLGGGNALADGGEALAVSEDFAPLGFTSNGEFSGEVVFAGYGIVAREPEKGLDYDDYAGLDVKGKVVLAMRYEPGENDEKSPFDGKKPSRYSDLRNKALRARQAGAAALVLVAPAREGDDTDKVPPLKKGGPSSRAGLPVVQVTREVAERWLAKAGTTLKDAQAAIDGPAGQSQPKPASFAIPGLTLSGKADVNPTEAQARNVIGILPGDGALEKEYVVVGAHYDHLGHGGDGSMRPDSTDIHNGADDNASGTAAMICAMADLVQNGSRSARRTVVGMAFAAEEIGLGGSQFYVDNPVVPLEQTVAMINLDMVGRVRDNKLQALGADTAPEWKELLAAAGASTELQVDGSGDGYGPSDQTSFYEKKIPVVHLFSGAHEQYHTPDDDAPTLNMQGGAQVSRLVAQLADAVATREGRLTYVESTSGPRMQGDSRGYGAYLGTIPDFTSMNATEGGVKLSGVRKDGPADRAGIRGGDILVGLAGAEVQNTSDMAILLQDHKPGETVEVVVMREGQRVTMMATLGKRGENKPAASAENPLDHPEKFSIGADAPAGPHGGGEWAPTAGKAVPQLVRPEEKHLADLRQLTFGGDNAEAYWSPDGRHLIFQRNPNPMGDGPGKTCDQQYSLDLTTGEVKRISSGKGRTTCGYYAYPDGQRFIYATTALGGGDSCPPEPDRSQGYVWPLYDSFDLVWHEPGKEPTPLLSTPGYDAEATACMKDGRLVFTSVRDGYLDLYMANPDGSGLTRLTSEVGYDGGAFFNTSCTAIVWRASRPKGEALADYKRLLEQDLVRPSSLELFWMDLATKKVTQLTDNGKANFGPYPLPDDSGVVFSSNLGGSEREFDIYEVARAGGQPVPVTTAEGFDGFPMFSPDGKWFVFASNRANEPGRRDTNLFVARWIP